MTGGTCVVNGHLPRTPLHRTRTLALPARRQVVGATRLQRLGVEQELGRAAASSSIASEGHGGDQVRHNAQAPATKQVVVKHMGKERTRLTQDGDACTLRMTL